LLFYLNEKRVLLGILKFKFAYCAELYTGKRRGDRESDRKHIVHFRYLNYAY